jgi:hypothetical protein
MTDNEKIALAIDKIKAADILHVEADDLLEDICVAAATRRNKEELQALIVKLPQGFYRTELRVLLSTLEAA